jgi:hypothetical protein
MMECWNIGIMGWRPSGRYTPAAVAYWKFFKMVLIIPYKHDKIPLLRFTIPLFHHSIIPVWNMQNVWLGIPYYQQFVEFPIHII